jgi:hypothetical protein
MRTIQIQQKNKYTVQKAYLSIFQNISINYKYMYKYK